MRSHSIKRSFPIALTFFLIVLSSKLFLFPVEATEASAQNFITGTPVRTESGPRIIETLQTGDRVWGEDEEHGQVELKAVPATSEQEVAATWQITFANGEKIETIASRPLYVEGYGFKSADHLVVGDSIVTREGSSQGITSIQQRSQSKTVHSLSVADCNTCFVGESRFWVSN